MPQQAPVLYKSIDGIPAPAFPLPRGVVLADEARTARRRFYPVTLLYTAYALPVLFLAFRSSPWTALCFVAAGTAVWTYLEYQVHRHVLHGRFPDGPGLLRHWLHLLFDKSHANHHQRPWDGMYINGRLDTLPFAIVLALLSFLLPLPTAPVLIATVLQCYVIEEWVHYSVHFHRFRSRYFEYIRRHHLYHHSAKGSIVAYGLTTGIWDRLAGTRVPDRDRRLLHGRRQSAPEASVGFDPPAGADPAAVPSPENPPQPG